MASAWWSRQTSSCSTCAIRPARKHLDSVIDRLVSEYGIGYFKFDYNVSPVPAPIMTPMLPVRACSAITVPTAIGSMGCASATPM